MSDSLGIISLDSALSMLKDDYKKRCFTIWKQFTDFCGEDYDEFPPGEGALYGYFKSLREDKNMASSSIWHHYSCINTVVKNRYSTKLQDFPRITSLLKSWNDFKKKASIFDSDDVSTFVLNENYTTPYWIVRKVSTLFKTMKT